MSERRWLPERMYRRLLSSQLFAWRRKAKASGVGAPLATAANKPVKFARLDAMRSDMVEIVIGDVVVRAGSDVRMTGLPM
jgi:hypothetical protein